MAMAVTTDDRRLAKRQRFTKLAPKRTTQVLKALRRLEQTANVRSYESTVEEREEILRAVADAVESLAREMRREKPQRALEFKFSQGAR